VPNLPFFYLVFRAWSHWKSLLGSKHIQFLLDKKLINIQASPILDNLYLGQNPTSADSAKLLEPITQSIPGTEETMLLTEAQGKEMATVIEIPELYIELKRAVWQVERSLEKQKEIGKEKVEEKPSNNEK